MSADNSGSGKEPDNNVNPISDAQLRGAIELSVLQSSLMTPSHTPLRQAANRLRSGLPLTDEAVHRKDYAAYASPLVGGARVQPVDTGDPMEKKLDIARKQYERRLKTEEELGLTPDLMSLPTTRGSPFSEAIDIEEQITERREERGFRRDTFWKSCCGAVMDRRATQYFVQVAIGMGVMAFCMAKIWNAAPFDCSGEDTTVYFSLISALVGFYIPSPTMSKP